MEDWRILGRLEHLSFSFSSWVLFNLQDIRLPPLIRERRGKRAVWILLTRLSPIAEAYRCTISYLLSSGLISGRKIKTRKWRAVPLQQILMVFSKQRLTFLRVTRWLVINCSFPCEPVIGYTTSSWELISRPLQRRDFYRPETHFLFTSFEANLYLF